MVHFSDYGSYPWRNLARLTGLSLLPFLAAGCGPSSSPSGHEESGARAPIVFAASTIGEPVQGTPWITDLTIVDLDEDGLLDIVACDGKANEVRWLRQSPSGSFTESALGAPVPGPAHVEACDFDRDGDLDLLVASMGVIFPNNEKIGSVVILEQTGAGASEWRHHVVLDKVARVTDVQAGDLDGDGRLDLAVAQFGYHQGEGRWMRNLGRSEDGSWSFQSRLLTNLAGGIHSPIADVTGDGEVDITMLISQEWEEIHVYENTTKPAGELDRFVLRKVFGSTNEDYGSSGIILDDLDQDGDLDIVYTNGDAFDYARPGPRPWHGLQWLENDGSGNFEFHRLGDFPGAYGPAAADLDGDGDRDIVAVSGFNDWTDPEAVSLMWFENDGRQAFTPHVLARQPTHLIVAEVADIDGDGRAEIVTGSLNAYPPFNHVGRITLWKRE